MALEGEGALAVSLFTGFPHADIRDAGLSVVAITDGDDASARSMRDELLDQAWADRRAFVYEPEPLEDSMARRRRWPPSPARVPLSCWITTTTMDTTEVLAAVLEADLDDAAFFSIYDPEAVAAMAAAGVGSDVTVNLGGKLQMPALAQQSRPLSVTGRVRLLSEGRFPATVACPGD